MKHVALAFLVGTLLPLASHAQDTPPSEYRHVSLDSGWVANDGGAGQIVFSEVVRVDQAPWMRLHFDQAELGAGAFLRVTSLLDGHSQSLYAEHLEQWGDSTAYFNGDSLLVEIVAPASSEPSRLSLRHIEAGQYFAGYESQCGSQDDRVPSSRPGVARLLPIGCTGWIADDPGGCNCLGTAGHCMGGTSIVQFNVPPSLAGGTIVNPPPADQYAVDPASTQSTNGGIGNDWAYFGTFPNSETGLTPFEDEAFAFTIQAPQPIQIPQTIRITGYGVDSGTANQVQQTHTGPRVPNGGATALEYQVDTTGGNSGSPVVSEATGASIGIHTNAGCNLSSGSGNTGTAVINNGFMNAVANPQGVCVKTAGSYFQYGLGVGGTNIGTLRGYGNPAGGGPVGFRVRNVPNGTSAFVYASSTADFTPGLGGTVLAGPAQAQINFSFSGGSGQFGVILPPALSGSTFFLQGVVTDPSSPSGFSLTNGLRMFVF